MTKNEKKLTSLRALAKQSKNSETMQERLLRRFTPRNDKTNSRSDLPSRQIKVAFTLAEVLITLGIIGIVAAMTIPMFIAKYQEKVWNSSADVFSKKLTDALRLMNTQNSIQGYQSTEEFTDAFQKYMKIIRICKNNELEQCFSSNFTPSIINFDNDNATTDKLINVKDLKTSSDLGIDWGKNIVGVQFNNGVSALLTYNPACVGDQYNNQFNPTNCVSMLYDTNGFARPNSTGKDIRNFGQINLAFLKFNNKTWSMPFVAAPVDYNECTSMKENGMVNACYESGWFWSYGGDYWAGTVKACGGKDNMPNKEDLAALANSIYTNECKQNSTCLNNEKFKIFLTTNYSNDFASATEVYIWSAEEVNGNVSYYQMFGTNSTTYWYANPGIRGIVHNISICKAK